MKIFSLAISVNVGWRTFRGNDPEESTDQTRNYRATELLLLSFIGDEGNAIGDIGVGTIWNSVSILSARRENKKQRAQPLPGEFRKSQEREVGETYGERLRDEQIGPWSLNR